MFPKRGAFAVFITTFALVALLNYKTPELPRYDYGGASADPTAFQPALVAVASASSWAPLGSAAASDPGSLATDSPRPDQPAASPWISPMRPSPSTSSAPATPRKTAAPARTAATVATRPPTLPPATGQPKSTPVITPTSAATPITTPAGGRTGTVDGAVVAIHWGNVQVRAVFSNGRIVDVITLQAPNGDPHSISLSNGACPILRSEALTAQSAKIDTVTSATYTSNAYKTSLQSAIDHP